MKVSYNWLSSYFKKPLIGGALPHPDKLAALFNSHFAEIEGVEKVDGDTVFDIKTLADRNHYALCHRGIAHEAAAITKKPVKASISPEIAVQQGVARVTVTVADSTLCPRYMARRMEGLKVGPSPEWLHNRLESIGARSINTVVDATNFVMFDVGQPLHAFDADKVRGGISVRLAKEGEKITLLDGREIELKQSDLVIADDEGPLAIAGVKGGKRAEVTADTTSVILEAANFNPTTVRRTSTRANIRNDSSKRFENEITPALAEDAMARVTSLVAELSAGAKAGPVTDVYPKPVKSWTVTVDPAYMNAVTGLDLSAAAMADILRRLRCAVETRGGQEGVLMVTPPLERLDLTIPEDFADEVVRMYGYDKLESKQLPDIGQTPIDATFYAAEKVKNALVTLGFSESLLYTLVPKGAFEIAYPLASDKAALRERIAPKVVESLTLNSRNADLLGLETIKIFEIGTVFPKTGEKASICIGVSQVKKKKGVTSESVLKEALTIFEQQFGVKIDGKVEVGPYGALIEADFAPIVASIKPGNLQSLDFQALPADKKYVPFSPYPYITRDIALFVPSGTTDSAVSSVIAAAAAKAAGKLLVKGPAMFDRFEKDAKVSFAFRMIFQSFEKTLSDDEVNALMAKVYEAAKEKGWEVR